VDFAREEAPAEEGAALQGTGISAGVGLGPARILAPGEPPRIEPGEVLVAPVLDAALGPLLATAAAAVAEVGGMLSHGAVVARELGIPCAVDVRGATRRIRAGDRVLVDGGSGRVRVLASAEGPGPVSGAPPATLSPVADDGLRGLEAHPLARESVYVNAFDAEAGLAVVASLGVRPGGHGEALLALGLPGGHVLFGLVFEEVRGDRETLAVGGAAFSWRPPRLSFRGRLAPHEGAAFPPGALPLLLSPATVEVALELDFEPTTPAVDLADGLDPETLDALRLLGRHHVEQSGRWRGAIRLDGRRLAFDGTGSRDHSWGLRDWEAADHWRLFTVRLGDDLAVHALAVAAEGRLAEGGFLWRGERAERISRVRYAFERGSDRRRSFELEVAPEAGEGLLLRGTVLRTLPVPVQVERRPSRHVAGRPWRLVLVENFCRYEAQGRAGHGVAEITERPL
jgi:phosphohistidine swiveling domain-containing protein